jgi:threonine aldolase
MIDLRSDTVTRPSAPMRAAMAAAAVGDDQFGEDPSVNALQEQVAELLGHEAGLWVPTGTMANQVALRLLTSPGDDVVVSAESHSVWHEAGASAANAGVQFTAVGAAGRFTGADLAGVAKPRGHMLFPPTTLVQVENTHNRAGGLAWDRAGVTDVIEAARALGIASYCDGARLWNAAVATGERLADLASGFDCVSVAFSKGLGAPAGSMLVGSADLIAAAVRIRRMFGGAMRQAGVLAAAAEFGLAQHLNRLVEDHANAAAIGAALAGLPGVTVRPVQTNIVVFDLDESLPDAATVVASAADRGVGVLAFAPRTVRAVTHLDVDAAQCTTAAASLCEAVAAG